MNRNAVSPFTAADYDSDGSHNDFPRRRGAQQSSLLSLLSIVAIVVSLVAVALSGVAITRASTSSSAEASLPTIVGALSGSPMRTVTFRLFPGEELLSGLMRRVNALGLQAAWIVTTVGSLTHYEIRYANQPNATPGDGHFEIVSLVGTLTSTGNGRPGVANAGAWHVHISLGDGTGRTVSGHLEPGNIIYTTAEVVLGYACGFRYYRADDGTTGYDELQIVNASWC